MKTQKSYAKSSNKIPIKRKKASETMENRGMTRSDARSLLTVFGTVFFLKDLPCFQSARSLSGIRKHKLALAVGGTLSSAKIGSAKAVLPPWLPPYARKAFFSQPMQGFSLLVP